MTIPHDERATTLAPRVVRRKNRARLILGLAAALVLLSGGATLAVLALARTDSSTAQTFEVHGTLTNRIGCEGLGGAPDVRTGAQITLTDSGGKVVGVGTLQGTRSASECSYTFTFAGVPAGARFYGISVGRHGPSQFTEQQLRAGPQVNVTS